jgi:DNA polymerase V
MYSISTLKSSALKAEPNLTQTPVHAALEPATHDLPLLAHRISAGFPSPAADYIEVGLDLNDYLASIEEGDKVIVDRALTPKHRDIVVAVVDGDYTLKRLFKHRGRVELRAENPAYQHIEFKDGSELLVWGVVVGVVRRYSARGG